MISNRTSVQGRIGSERGQHPANAIDNTNGHLAAVRPRRTPQSRAGPLLSTGGDPERELFSIGSCAIQLASGCLVSPGRHRDS